MLNRKILDQAFIVSYDKALQEVNTFSLHVNKEIVLVPVIIETPKGKEEIKYLQDTNIDIIYNRMLREEKIC